MHPRLRPMAFVLALLTTGAAHAGRPLLVEDAGVNAPGEGHVEAWFERAPGDARHWTLAPAWSPAPGLELAAAVQRDARQQQTLARLQAKWQLRAPSDAQCGQAAVLGADRLRHQGHTTPWLNGVLSCPVGAGTLHLNLGLSKSHGERVAPAVGAAWERELGFATGHVEWLAARGSRPIVNLGLRRELAPGLQLDGSLGRSGGRALFSVGLKYQF